MLFTKNLFNLLQQSESLEFYFDPYDIYNEDQIDSILNFWKKIIKKISKQN